MQSHSLVVDSILQKGVSFNYSVVLHCDTKRKVYTFENTTKMHISMVIIVFLTLLCEHF